MVLMYYRAYRTQYHIGITYGISESWVSEMIKEIESIIIQDARYNSQVRKNCCYRKNTFEEVLIDVSERPVERPKKNAGIIQARKSETPKNTSNCR